MIVKLLNMDKQERKSCIRNIEKHLRNYNYYLKAITNIEKQLSKFSSNEIPKYSETRIINGNGNKSSLEGIQIELNLLKLITENIAEAIKELDDVEIKYIEYRYFKKWSVNKSALEIGYSEKALFAIRNQLMDKLLLLLGSIIYIE